MGKKDNALVPLVPPENKVGLPLFYCMLYIFFHLNENDLNCAALYVNLFSLYILEILEQARRIVRVC